MDITERLNELADYIEQHLIDEIDYRELAHLMGCSEYHLSRMFPFITGQGLAHYIRRRRMSQAALDLHKDSDLLQIAIRYGYSSVDSLSRAFREIHGTSPAAVLKEGAVVRSFPKLSFSVTIKGAEAMQYRIVSKEAFRIIGISKTVPIVFSGPNEEIDAMWRTLTPELISSLKALSDTEPSGFISASVNFSEGRMEEKGTLDHYIGVASTHLPDPNHLSVLEVKEGTWAIFEAVGNFPENLQNIWGRIYSEWFPVSAYELREGPEILWNEGPDTTKPDFRSEIWIPVIAKRS